ncbi:MAG TPA: PAS domain-containing protein, partial [Solirubrobacteraceae bacterium]|nr:PAS domain-containing protein [Solirubrobacteraceae bacterium]
MLFAVDLATGTSTVLVPAYVLAPLVAAVAAHPRATAAVAALTVVLAAIVLALDGMGGQDVVRLVTVVAGSGLAVWIASLRRALQVRIADRRTAERALRAQTDRYEALLLALSDAGEGLVVLEHDGRCMFANSAFEQISGYAFPELTAMDTLLDLVVEYDDEEVRRRVLDSIDEGDVRPRLPLTLRHRAGPLVDVEVGGMQLVVEDRAQLVVVVRDVTERRRAESERERLLARAALLAEASEHFDRSLDEELTMQSVARLCVRDVATTCVILLVDDLG